MNLASDPVDDDYEGLPESPEEAFVHLERIFRKRLDKMLDENTSDATYAHYTSQYVNQVLAAVKALELNLLSDWLSKGRVVNNQQYDMFRHDVENEVIQINIRRSRRSRGYSVSLDTPSRARIRHFINQIRKMIDKLEVSDSKRKALHSRLTAFASEVDRDRTRYEAFAAFVIDLSTVASVGSKPIRELMDSIANLMGKAREMEGGFPRLASSAKPKQIEGPTNSQRPQGEPSSPEAPQLGTLDDEIPF